MSGAASSAERSQFEERTRRLLIRRARAGMWILLPFVALFAIADRIFNPGNFDAAQIDQLTLLRGAQVIAITLGFGALRRRSTLRGVIAVSVLLVATFNTAVVLAGIVIRDFTLGPTVLMSTNMFSAAFLPWGTAAQCVIAAASASGIVANVLAVAPHAGAVLGYNQLEAFAGLAASVWVAAMLERQRLELFLSQKARDAAVEAQLGEARVADALSRVGREMIEAADTPQLIERMCAVTASVLGCDATHAVLRDRESTAYVPVAAHGQAPERWELLRLVRLTPAQREDLARRLAEDGTAEVLPAAAPLPEDSVEGAVARLGATRALCMALRRGDELVGVLYAEDHGDTGPFSAEQKRIARGIAHLASMTIEHARVREELERANQVKAHFVATLSHELRNPISAIRGYNYLLLEGIAGPLAADQETAVRGSEKCATELGDLITQTLDLSRFEAKRVPLDVQVVHVPDLLDELRREIPQPQADGAVRLEWPPHATGADLRTDALKLKMVLRNLVTNALKFTERGAVTVSADSCVDGVEFRVCDTGIGIAAEKIPTIFEPFTQAHGLESRRKGGAGLGLHLVRRLVDVLGGSIDVASEVGRGTTFRVRVPQAASGTHEA